jgi:hypothetical protein
MTQLDDSKNTELDEILQEFVDAGTIEPYFDEVDFDVAKRQIQALVEQQVLIGRINELEQLRHFKDNPGHVPSYGYLEWDYEERLTSLQSQQKRQDNATN